MKTGKFLFALGTQSVTILALFLMSQGNAQTSSCTTTVSPSGQSKNTTCVSISQGTPSYGSASRGEVFTESSQNCIQWGIDNFGAQVCQSYDQVKRWSETRPVTVPLTRYNTLISYRLTNGSWVEVERFTSTDTGGSRSYTQSRSCSQRLSQPSASCGGWSS